MKEISRRTLLEMARGFSFQRNMFSTPDALERLSTLLWYQHNDCLTFSTDVDERLYVVVGKEKFVEPKSPDFPSAELVARVILAVKFGDAE